MVNAAPRGAPRGAIVATLVGNTLEFYDFLIYAFFAVHIGNAFFPTSDPTASLLLSVATFGIGFLTRPLGGMVIGAYADRAGRKPALLLTVALMSLGTIGLVATPSYASIGLAAPIILVLSRLAQGFAIGGEVGPANAVLLESAPEGKRAIYMSMQAASQGVATLAGGITGLIVAAILTRAELAAWGWRIPFAVGLALIPVGIYMRRALPETLPQPKHASASAALRAVWREHRMEVVLLSLVAGGSSIATYIILYMTTFATKTLGMPSTVAMLAPIAAGSMALVMAPLGGVLCEKLGRRQAFLTSRLAAATIIVPAYMLLIDQRSVAALLAVVVVIAAVGAPSSVATVTVMAEAFPTESRSAGIALTYAAATTIFGATTQFVITWLIDLTGSPLAPACYGLAASLMSVAAALALFARQAGSRA